MKLEVIEKKEEPLFNRENIKVNLNFEGKTPSRQSLKDKLSTQLKANSELVIIRKIGQKFGSTSASCEARIYKDVESLKKLESQKYIKNNTKESKEEAKEGEQ